MSEPGTISQLIEGLAAAGASVDAILIAVRALEARDVADADRRAKVAERKRNERERKLQSRDSHRTVTGQSSDPPNDISNPHETPVEANASTAPRGRSKGFRIPDDWTPPPIAELSPEAKALAAQWPDWAYRAEAEAFKNFWLTETRVTSRKSDWNRAWCNRVVAVNGKVLREAKFAPKTENGADLGRWETPEAKAAYLASLEDRERRAQPIGAIVSALGVTH